MLNTLFPFNYHIIEFGNLQNFTLFTATRGCVSSKNGFLKRKILGSFMAGLARVVLTFIIIIFSPGFIYGETLTATEIVRRSDELNRRDASYGKVSMMIRRPDWTRTLEIEAWTQGTKNSFIRILSPKKEKGVTFLKKGREAWQYIPSIDRVIKIPPSMMLQSWLGSDFTNDDIVRADSLVVDYDHTIRQQETDRTVGLWIIEGIPKPDAAVVWGKVVFKIRKEDYVPERVDYYDEDGGLVKYYETFDIKPIEGLAVPTRLVMSDVIRAGYSTTLTYNVLTFQPDIKPGTFTTRNLKR